MPFSAIEEKVLSLMCYSIYIFSCQDLISLHDLVRLLRYSGYIETRCISFITRDERGGPPVVDK